jgi:hypothetical protein
MPPAAGVPAAFYRHATDQKVVSKLRTDIFMASQTIGLLDKNEAAQLGDRHLRGRHGLDVHACPGSTTSGQVGQIPHVATQCGTVTAPHGQAGENFNTAAQKVKVTEIALLHKD